jgi:acyl-CoA thioesterase-1
MLFAGLALGLTVVVAVFVGLQDRRPPPPSGVATRPPSLVCPDVPPSRRATLALGAHPYVLIFGDSYTEGYGAHPETEGFAYKVGALLGWRVQVDGVGGTGYVNPGPKNQGTYETRFSRLPKAKYDLIVIEGGSNDSRLPIEQLEPAVEATLRTVRAKFPTAQIALMGQLETHGTANEPRAAVNTVLTRYAAANRLVFFSPLCEKWFTRAEVSTLVNPANGHPNNAGYARATAMFVRDIGRNLAPSISKTPVPAR